MVRYDLLSCLILLPFAVVRVMGVLGTKQLEGAS